MLPINPYTTEATDVVTMPSYSYRLDLHTKRIIGHIDGIDAMVQALNKLFETERFAWEIYTSNYGIELENLIGQEIAFVTTSLEGRIRDAIVADDRVIDLQSISITQTDKDTLTVDCWIETTVGVLEYRKELMAA